VGTKTSAVAIKKSRHRLLEFPTFAKKCKGGPATFASHPARRQLLI
jgi:hypothetical protein